MDNLNDLNLVNDRMKRCNADNISDIIQPWLQNIFYKEAFPSCLIEADDSNNRVACTCLVGSKLPLPDNLTNKDVTTQCTHI